MNVYYQCEGVAVLKCILAGVVCALANNEIFCILQTSNKSLLRLKLSMLLTDLSVYLSRPYYIIGKFTFWFFNNLMKLSIIQQN